VQGLGSKHYLELNQMVFFCYSRQMCQCVNNHSCILILSGMLLFLTLFQELSDTFDVFYQFCIIMSNFLENNQINNPYQTDEKNQALHDPLRSSLYFTKFRLLFFYSTST